jgi:hypothetical protein
MDAWFSKGSEAATSHPATLIAAPRRIAELDQALEPKALIAASGQERNNLQAKVKPRAEAGQIMRLGVFGQNYGASTSHNFEPAPSSGNTSKPDHEKFSPSQYPCPASM